MAEQTVRKRGWVKNAAIIFLAVMLVLTFFSNTIMNYSLPEVAAQYVQSGAISPKIRVTGTVAAAQTYEVKSASAREVLSVPVKAGDKVNAGDTLVLFTDTQNDQIAEAQKALDALMLAYNKALLSSGDPDYTKQEREIGYAQKALEKANAARAANVYSAADLAKAKQEVTNAQSAVTSAQTVLTAAKTKADAAAAATAAAQSSLDALGSLNKDADDSAVVKTRREYTSKKNYYKSQLDELDQEAKNRPDKSVDAETYKLILAGQYAASDDDHLKEVAAAYQSVQEAKTAYETAFSAYTAAASSGNETEWNRLSAILSSAKAAQAAADQIQAAAANAKAAADDGKTAADEKYAALKAQKDAFDAADNDAETARKSLEDLMFALAEQKKTDGKTLAGTNLDLEDQRRQIEDKKAEIAKLKGSGSGQAAVSKVSGVVASVNVTPGATTDPSTPMMVVELPEKGYVMEASVTKEQSRKLKPGDQAEMADYYGDSPVKATLSSIKADPKDPSGSRLLVFRLEGDSLQSGDQLTLSVGERGGNYDAVVPTSAIRTDNNGSFVLAVTVKSSPLGNRYVAQRVDVKILASDDTNSAVSGGLTTSDFVITTSNKPVEPGKQVRLPDQAG